MSNTTRPLGFSDLSDRPRDIQSARAADVPVENTNVFGSQEDVCARINGTGFGRSLQSCTPIYSTGSWTLKDNQAIFCTIPRSGGVTPSDLTW